MYDFMTMERLPAQSPGIDEEAGHVSLPGIKVVAQPPRASLTPLNVTVGNFARMTRFGVDSDGAVVAAQTLTVTLRYRSEARTKQNLTRFMQLYSDTTGVVAQNDSLPAQGANPTGSWVPGETITEEVTLSIPMEVPGGQYTLLTGLYDLETGQRVPLTAKDTDLPDAALRLAEVTVSRPQSAPPP